MGKPSFIAELAQDGLTWRALAQFPDYWISEAGDVMRRTISRGGSYPGKRLRPAIDAARRRRFRVYDYAGSLIQIFAHQLVVRAFHGAPPSPMHQVAHGDGDAANNHYINLRWATPKENNGDKYRHGTMPFGEKSASRRLTERDVRSLRAEHKAGDAGCRKLARRYGVSKTQVLNILSRKSWPHVEG